SRADLTDANLYGANLNDANLYGANLSDANLYGANLNDANLYGANLSDANLYGANLNDANLYGANLSGADLSGADLRRANLYGANLYGADLSGAKIAEGITVSRAPIQIYGLHWPITIWDQHMQIGCKFYSHAEWSDFDDNDIAEMDDYAAEFWRQHKSQLLSLCAFHASQCTAAAG
ncbi:MAG: pentapeptide repeat-containing protein, partial [Acidithiobacillus sp.]